ncbi:hypothetical protein QBC34DRAFT_34517 [Podospora aff. communis PSN243]|uniref:Zn(2)-C6 fungal-type domain-containing protein n=1 Tax=Podospora aff. communis PSN243 TaxID=3040156 RepID=A0AAV9GVK6_9PEZI|nr:hypothetical protein QBC34DRAFT_34517 [Podospora aff. communis PSN243]
MASAKPRQQRLRASCDGCFLAKVKCSKARPICSRCLACGIECRYSPSSRAGKPKSDSSANMHNSVVGDMSAMSPVSDDKGMVFPSQHTVPGLYKLETGWHTPPTSVDGGMSRSHSMSGLAMMGVEPGPAGHGDPNMAGDMYSAGMPWTPPNDMTAQFVESPGIAPHMGQGHGRSQSYDFAMPSPMGAWPDPNAHDMYAYSQTQLPTPGSIPANYFPSPTATPHLRPSPRHKSVSVAPNGSAGSCACFSACLQSLQALHNASGPSPPPFDIVLSLNRKAVEGCASMMSCPRCMSRSGTHTSAMLLATVIGKITSFYKNASHTYFENGAMQSAASPSALGVSLGAYTLMGEEGRWLEMEILARELRKLEEVYAQFREVCADLSEDPEVSKAMIGYLGHTLGSTLEVIHHRKGDMTYT